MIYVVRQGNILKNGAGLHGADIVGSYLYPGTTVIIGEIHDNWGLVIGPPVGEPGGLVQPDGTYLNYKQKGWFPIAHLTPVNSEEHEYQIIVDATTGAVKSCVMIR